MDFGSLDGLVNATEKVVYDSGELATAVTSLTISGLDGDDAEEYTLYARIVSGAANSLYQVNINGDATASSGYQVIKGVAGDATAYRAADSSYFYLFQNDNLDSGQISMGQYDIYAKSGQPRTIIHKVAGKISTTTVTSVELTGTSWGNTANNIVSMDVVASETNGIGIGSRIILMKKVTATTGMRTGVLNVGQPLVNATVNRSCVLKGMWQTIYKNTLASAATSVTISGLDGNTDVMYRLNVRAVNGASANTSVYVTWNTDTTAANYGFQFLSGINTDAGATRSTAWYGYIIQAMGAITKLGMGEMLIYAKSGYVRTMLNEHAYTISTTTITGIMLYGQVWNNTANNMTQMVVTADQADGLGIGTEIGLERLIP